MACGGGNNGGGNNSAGATAKTGVLKDAAIAGVPYTTTSGRSGTTDANGRYDYAEGDTVTFNVGGVTFTLPSVPEVTPAVLAQALYPADSAKASNAALNLAAFFQTLDSDNNPDNGITIPSTLAITGGEALKAALEQAPATFTQTLNDNDSVTPGAKTAVSAADAAKHYYDTELTGTWVFEDANQLFTITFDARAGGESSKRYIIAEVGKTNNPGTGVEAGVVDVEDSGKVVLVQLGNEDKTRELATSCPAVYGEQIDEEQEVVIGTGSELKFVGDKLTLTYNGSGESCAQKTLTLSRHVPVKGTMVGTWLEGSTVLNNGNPVFSRVTGNQGVTGFDELVSIFFSDRILFITLDCENDGCGPIEDSEREINGLTLVNYSFANNIITFGAELVDTSNVSIDSGDTLTLSAATNNDTRRTFQECDSVEITNCQDETVTYDRLLSSSDLRGDFAPGEKAPVSSTASQGQ